jgi:L-ascorbate metabolism protein UlaG (beta-lactamase superfamily)
MKIKYITTSSFLITSDKGTRVVTDPYFHNFRPDNAENLPEWMMARPGITEYADVVVISHPHFDHSYIYTIKGVPRLYTGGAPVEIKGVKFSGVATKHDNYGEAGGILPTRGPNNAIGIEVDGIRIWHMGDYGLQKKIYDEQLAQFGRVDILLTPWGDFVQGIIDQFNPKVVFPMHHTTVDQVKGMKGFTDLSSKTSEMELTTKTLPSEMKFIMLKASM